MIDALRRRPLYSACNEDSRSELRALAPGRDDTVVCISAGGGRALALLGAGPRRVVAIDGRESQLHTLELKAAALDALPLAPLRGFLGVDGDAHRLEAYAQLRPSLTPRARRYWDLRRSLLRCGVLYAGRLETTLARYAAWMRRAGVLVWPRACFAAATLDEQRAVLARSAAEIARGERLWGASFHPLASAIVLQDPSFRRSTEGSVGVYLYRRMLAFARRRLLRESALLHLIYHGRFDPAGALPIWLTPEASEQARKHLARLELRCASIEEVPARLPRGAPVKWSLSDISAWMPQERFHALVARIVAHGAPGSRLCWRHLAAQWSLPRVSGLAHEPALARQLERDDTSVFYTFGVAEIAVRSSMPGTANVSITYCTQCRWLLRAAWIAQELLTTFEQELAGVTLVPGSGGVFEVRVGDEVVWSRKEAGRFPEAAELKRLVRDRVAPGRSLGHSDGDAK